MDVVFLIGRILLAVLFVMSAVGHFTAAEGMAQYAAAKKVPAKAPAKRTARKAG
mgnify:CR=1 FL=1